MWQHKTVSFFVEIISWQIKNSSSNQSTRQYLFIFSGSDSHYCDSATARFLQSLVESLDLAQDIYVHELNIIN